MHRIIRGIISTAFVVAVAAVAQTAWAVPVQFASFTQQAGGNTPFRFIDTGFDTITNTSGSPSLFGLYDAGGSAISIDVNFQFQTANGYGASIGSNIDATMTMTSKARGVTSGATALSQQVQEVEIVFTAKTPLNGKTNLLTVTKTLSDAPINVGSADVTKNGTIGTNGFLSGVSGGSTASFTATERTSSSSNITYIGYTSDFLDFFTPTFSNRNFQIGLSNVNPVDPTNPGFDRGPNSPGGSNSSDYVQNFTASASGTFGSDPLPFNVPEPTSVVLMGSALSLVGLAVRRNRRG